jgi:O-antigen ligase
MLLIITALNFFNFFYTMNNYFTIVAATLNIACLIFFYFVSINVQGRRAFFLLGITAFSGLLVSFITYAQFAGYFILFKWAYKGMMVMGTIGNSNYLGAYFIFPLFAMAGFIFLLKGNWRILPAFLLILMTGAFLLTRARAGWFGFFLSFPVFLIILKFIFRFSLFDYLSKNALKVTTGVILAAVVIAALILVAPDRFQRMMRFENVTQSDTLRLRIQKYYAGSWWLFKQSPLFGTGLWSFRNRVYWAQAEINKNDPGFFKDYPEPKPRRVHTEYLEILNDGGLVAAAVLSLFFLIIMRHGWLVIRDEKNVTQDRVIAATAFSSLIAIMLSCFFFFSFRINSTLFMTVLMMGIIEGLYIHNYGLIKKVQGWKSFSGRFLIPVIVVLLIGVSWFMAVKPFKAEREHFKYKRALQTGKAQEAEKHLLKAIEYDPHNTAYSLYAAQLYMNVIRNFPKANDYLDKAIIDYNGDITRWSIFFFKGILKFQSGSLYEARNAFETALYFNPEFQGAIQKLKEVNQVIKDHDRVMIKFR